MTATCTKHSTHTTREVSGSVLKSVRGAVRRTPEGVRKQQYELMAKMLGNGVPRDGIELQMAVMSGQPLPAIEDHAPAVWATLQAARAQMMGGE
mgnify:CR=1 FL=1